MKRPKTTKDEERESSLLKWDKGAHSTDNIVGEIQGGFIIRHLLQETLNHMCYTSTILPKQFKEALQDVHWIKFIQEKLNKI